MQGQTVLKNELCSAEQTLIN